MDEAWKLRLFLGAVAVASFWFWFRWWQKARLIADTPHSRIRSAAQGYVELHGRGELSGSQTMAPLSRRPCIWWTYKIECYESAGRRSAWRTVDSGTSTLPFLLQDDEHWCVVNPTGAEVFPGDKSVWRGSTAWPEAGPQSERVRAFGSGTYRYTEHRIYEHELLDIIGEFRSVGGVQSVDKTAAVSELMRQWKQDQPAMLQRFDDNHDGVLSAMEWERARTAAQSEIDQRMLVQPPVNYSVLMQPGDGRPFLIADYDLAKVGRRLRFYALFAVVAFVAAVFGLANSFIS